MSKPYSARTKSATPQTDYDIFTLPINRTGSAPRAAPRAECPHRSYKELQPDGGQIATGFRDVVLIAPTRRYNQDTPAARTVCATCPHRSYKELQPLGRRQLFGLARGPRRFLRGVTTSAPARRCGAASPVLIAPARSFNITRAACRSVSDQSSSFLRGVTTCSGTRSPRATSSPHRSYKELQRQVERDLDVAYLVLIAPAWSYNVMTWWVPSPNSRVLIAPRRSYNLSHRVFPGYASPILIGPTRSCNIVRFPEQPTCTCPRRSYKELQPAVGTGAAPGQGGVLMASTRSYKLIWWPSMPSRRLALIVPAKSYNQTVARSRQVSGVSSYRSCKELQRDQVRPGGRRGARLHRPFKELHLPIWDIAAQVATSSLLLLGVTT